MSQITVQTLINAPVQKVWEFYTAPEHIMKWNHASSDWSCPKAENDLRVGGVFNYRMESKDGKEGFDFKGMYFEIIPDKFIAYNFGDRKASVEFREEAGFTNLIVTFDPETENPVEMQKSGWQAILDNFKKCVESE